LGYSTVSVGDHFPTLQWSEVPSYSRTVSSRSLAIILGLFDPEQKGTTFLQNLANCLHNDTAFHPWRLKSSTTPLYKPQILQNKIYLTVLF